MVRKVDLRQLFIYLFFIDKIESVLTSWWLPKDQLPFIFRVRLSATLEKVSYDTIAWSALLSFGGSTHHGPNLFISGNALVNSLLR